MGQTGIERHRQLGTERPAAPIRPDAEKRRHRATGPPRRADRRSRASSTSTASRAGITPLTADERAILRLVNQRVAALPTLDDVIDLLFERTAGIFPFDRMGLPSSKRAADASCRCYVRATYERVLLAKGYSEDLRDSSLERVLERGTPRIIDDLERYLAEHPRSRSTRLLVREGVRSSLTCPLIVEGRVVGLHVPQLARAARLRPSTTSSCRWPSPSA